MSRVATISRRHFETGAVIHRRCKCRRALKEIETELAELREQNRLLQDSARFFADLSERLNTRLRRERTETRAIR